MSKEELVKIFSSNKEDLSRLAKIDKRIQEIDRTIVKIKANMILKITPGYILPSGKTNQVSSKVENTIEQKEEKIEDLELEKEELLAEKEVLEDRTQDVEIVLKALKFKEATVIKEHYIEGNSYEDIGSRVFWQLFNRTMSVRNIKNIEDIAMEKMLKIMK